MPKLNWQLWTLEMYLWMPKRWRWMPDRDRMMALNAKLWRDSNSKRQTGDATLNAKLKPWLWMPNWRCDYEHQTENVALNTKLRRTILNVITKNIWQLWTSSYKEIAALNAITKKGRWFWTPNWKEMVTLNIQIEKRWWLWTPKLRRDSGSESQTVKDDFERRNWEDMATLNAITNKGWWLWTLNWKEMVALNAESEKR